MYISHVWTATDFGLRDPSPKTVGIVAKRRSANFGVYNVRLLRALDKLLRDKPRYMGELSSSINDALLAYYSKTGEGKLKSPTKGQWVAMRSYDTMSELHRRELHQTLSRLSAMQPVSADVEEPDGTYYEYDRNLKATVKVTPDGERTPVAALQIQFERAPQMGINN